MAAVALTLALGVGSASAAFSIESFDGENIATEAGDTATQAGSHPYASTTGMQFSKSPGEYGYPMPDGPVKVQKVELPAGMIGNPNAVPQCTLAQFYGTSLGDEFPNCPNNSALGFAKVEFFGGLETYFFPVYNIVPGPNEPARFGLKIVSAFTFLQTAVRNGGDYGVTVTVANTPQVIALTGTALTFWGNPGAEIHDEERGRCLEIYGPNGNSCPYLDYPPEGNLPPHPFLTLPSGCSGPLKTTLHANSWLAQSVWQEASFLSHNAAEEPVGIEGCSKLPFNPRMSVQSESGKAASPAACRSTCMCRSQKPPKGSPPRRSKKRR